jgi:hypothetical protein
MKTILAHWKKDLISSRGLFIAWALCVIVILGILAFRLAGPNAVPSLLPSNPDGLPKVMALLFAGVMGFVGVAGLQFLLLTLLVARVIHLDPLVDPDAWWRTRPISGLSLLGAKSLYVAVCLLGAFATIGTIKFGDPTMLSAFLSATVFVVGVVAFASLTSDLGKLILNWLGIAVLASVLAQIILGLWHQTLVSLHSSSLSVDFHANATVGTYNAPVLIPLLYLAGFLAAIFCQYLQQRTNLSRAILFATFFFASLLKFSF